MFIIFKNLLIINIIIALFNYVLNNWFITTSIELFKRLIFNCLWYKNNFLIKLFMS